MMRSPEATSIADENAQLAQIRELARAQLEQRVIESQQQIAEKEEAQVKELADYLQVVLLDISEDKGTDFLIELFMDFGKRRELLPAALASEYGADIDPLFRQAINKLIAKGRQNMNSEDKQDFERSFEPFD